MNKTTPITTATPLASRTSGVLSLAILFCTVSATFNQKLAAQHVHCGREDTSLINTGSAAQIWNAALGELQVQVSKPNYQTWLSKTSGEDYKDGSFTIGVPSTFIAEYLEKNLLSLIGRVLSTILRRDLDIRFLVTETSAAKRRPEKTVPPTQSTLPLFNPALTFDSFTVGSCNQMAFAAAQGVSEDPGKTYNPLFICGPAGVGKTHLLQAIGNAATAKEMNVLYVRAEEYTNQMVSAIKEKTTEEFRKKYRSVDMLLLDDVQFFSGKTQTAESFFHTFDELLASNRQIAITSDKPPRSIPALEEKLSSRFEGGLIASIDSPDFDTRLAILKDKAHQKEADISGDILELIALQVKQNIRALEGSLNRIIAFARLQNGAITPEMAARAMHSIADGFAPVATPPTPKMIMEAVVSSFQLTPADIRSRKRDEATALARQVAMYLIRQETDCSLAQIGQELGGRTASTVTHAYQKIAEDINSVPALRRKITEIRQQFTAPATGNRTAC